MWDHKYVGIQEQAAYFDGRKLSRAAARLSFIFKKVCYMITIPVTVLSLSKTNFSQPSLLMHMMEDINRKILWGLINKMTARILLSLQECTRKK